MGKGKTTFVLATEFINLINRRREIEFETNFWIFMIHGPKEENVCWDNVF